MMQDFEVHISPLNPQLITTLEKVYFWEFCSQVLHKSQKQAQDLVPPFENGIFQ